MYNLYILYMYIYNFKISKGKMEKTYMETSDQLTLIVGCP